MEQKEINENEVEKVKEESQDNPKEDTNQKRTILDLADDNEVIMEDLEGIDLRRKTDTRNPFFKFLEKFGDLFFLNIIFVLSCLPVVTIGAAFITLFSVTNKMVYNIEDTVWKGYWKAFKNNFIIGTKILLGTVIYAIVIFYEYKMMMQIGGTTGKVIFFLIILELVLFALIYPMLIPLAARYENGLGKHVLNAFMISISNFKTWIVLFSIWFIPIIVYLINPTIFVYIWYLWILILCAAFAYASSMVLQKVYEKLENVDAVDNDEKKATEE